MTTPFQNLTGRSGDLLGFVADPLQVGNRLANRHDQAQIDRRGLATGHEIGAGHVDGHLHLVHTLVLFHDGLDDLAVAVGQYAESIAHLFLHHAAHACQVGANGVELDVELRGKMFVHNNLLMARLNQSGR